MERFVSFLLRAEIAVVALAIAIAAYNNPGPALTVSLWAAGIVALVFAAMAIRIIVWLFRGIGNLADNTAVHIGFGH